MRWQTQRWARWWLHRQLRMQSVLLPQPAWWWSILQIRYLTKVSTSRQKRSRSRYPWGMEEVRGRKNKGTLGHLRGRSSSHGNCHPAWSSMFLQPAIRCLLVVIHASQNAEIGNRFRQIFSLHVIRLFGYRVWSVVGRRNNKKSPCDVFEEIVIHKGW